MSFYQHCYDSDTADVTPCAAPYLSNINSSQVDKVVAAHLCPQNATTLWDRLALPSKACVKSTTELAAATVSPDYDCGLNDDTFICTGAQYRMYCNTSLHDFYYSRYEHQCWSNDCDCRGNKNTCTCYYRASSCFCQDSSSTQTLSRTYTGLKIILLKDYTDDALMEILNLVAVIVGLVFLSLALLTFAFCWWSPGVNNVARINICLSLLLAHLLFLLTQQFLKYIQPNQVLCTVISGVLHFLFLSSFVWMLIEGVLLFICVKSLSQISSKQREVLSSGFMIVIGYVTALVGVSVGLVPEGLGSEKCWIKRKEVFIWSFLGPLCVILALNMILFISIIVSLNSTLTKLNAGVSQMKQTKIMVFKTLAQIVVLGCPWILGVFTNSSKVLEILFLILNSQQGTFIFLIHCVLNNEIRQQYVERLSAIVPGLKPRTIKSAPQSSLSTSVSMYQRMRNTEEPLI
ncbi:adhesion G protein-coupled receptor E1-like [Xyrauchen texanus]|uniref:adhesion G protein-coupled receptor E1-like n=1 Tax=Xyrauchen texanus TaxID=154827 RepID=UPI002241B97A|nr:adhesion G protein-coupled receptor E1-like [Xyrauchen texanus]